MQAESEIDKLFAAPLEEFVAGRNALARRLKQEGEAGLAAEVAALRKPTLVAWAVNQLAHTRRRDVDLLLDAGKRIVDAQQASISEGGRESIDAARKALRSAVEALTTAGRTVLGERASQATVTQLADTLRSAATVAEGRELLALGRLTTVLHDTGWETVAALTPSTRAPAGDAPDAPRGKAASEKPDDEAGARAEAAARRKALRAEVREQQSLLARALKRQEAAQSRLERLQDEVEQAESAAAAADEAVAAIEQQLADAEQQLDEHTD